MRISSGAERWNIKKHDVNCGMSSSVTESYRRWVYLTIKGAILPKSHMILQTGEAMVLVYDLIILHKWYFRKLYAIK